MTCPIQRALGAKTTSVARITARAQINRCAAAVVMDTDCILTAKTASVSFHATALRFLLIALRQTFVAEPEVGLVSLVCIVP